MTTIYILWLRQIKRYSRSKARIIGSLGQPLLFLIAMGFGMGRMYKLATNGGNYMDFLAPGIIAMGIIFTGTFSGIEIIWDRQFGFLKETLVAPTSRINIMLGRTLGGATIAACQGFIILGISLLVGFRPQLSAITPLALVFIFLIALLFTALGTAIASLMDDFHGFQLIINFLIMPLFFLSGALFPLEDLPPAFKFITMINPLSYGIDGLRETLINVHHFGIATDLLVLGTVTAIIMTLGSYLFSKIQL
ncbi:MAG: ABC transporter permease [Sedimentisphaerales bacterium]|nr:ABC transporter permease [Sedimentisphaerales bacterium]